jgi:hypothetical protein
MNEFDRWWNSLSFADKYWEVINPDSSKGLLSEKLYKHWREVINFIPEVKPRKAKWSLQDYCVSNKIKPREVYAGFDTWNLRMKPKGAKILLDLFERGLIEQKTKNVFQDVSELKEYSKVSEGEIDKQEQEILTKNKRGKERFEYILEHPDEIQESEMTYNFLNNYSWEKFGKGSHRWQMREYSFYKDFILGRLSNSRKTRVSDTMVWIHIYNWDGSLYKVLKNSAAIAGPPPLNRRNDPNRNWGLPE